MQKNTVFLLLTASIVLISAQQMTAMAGKKARGAVARLEQAERRQGVKEKVKGCIFVMRREGKAPCLLLSRDDEGAFGHTESLPASYQGNTFETPGTAEDGSYQLYAKFVDSWDQRRESDSRWVRLGALLAGIQGARKDQYGKIFVLSDRGMIRLAPSLVEVIVNETSGSAIPGLPSFLQSLME